MVLSHLRLYSPVSGLRRRRFKRIFEGISLWLAVFLMLFVHPLYAEADGPGRINQWQETANPGRTCQVSQVARTGAGYWVCSSGGCCDDKASESVIA